ncbi:MAG: hypothetical protein IBX68_02415 [Dehalococcoidia bacterium]|nr:hypothetical protein [Dehalococcoidia bacterium]
MRSTVALSLLLVTTGFFIHVMNCGELHAAGGPIVWPTYQEVEVEAGEYVSEYVYIENQGDHPVLVSLYVADFTVRADGTFVFTEPGHGTYSASTWIALDMSETRVGPGERVEIPVHIAVPEDAGPGGHYAAVFVEMPSGPAESGVSISTRIPSLFYITVDSERGVIATAEIHRLVYPAIATGKPVETGVVLRNTGNVHLTIAARAYFKDMWGVGSELDLGQMVLLPGGEGTLRAFWDDSPFMGSVEVSVVAGYFDAEGNLIQKPAGATFWIVPWRELTGFVVAFPLLIAVGWVIRKKFSFRSPIKRK